MASRSKPIVKVAPVPNAPKISKKETDSSRKLADFANSDVTEFDTSLDGAVGAKQTNYREPTADYLKVPSYSEENDSQNSSFHSTPADSRHLVVTLLFASVLLFGLLFLLLFK